jgi:hypothetical protein
MLAAGLPGGDWKNAASSSNSWSASEMFFSKKKTDGIEFTLHFLIKNVAVP